MRRPNRKSLKPHAEPDLMRSALMLLVRLLARQTAADLIAHDDLEAEVPASGDVVLPTSKTKE